VKGKKLPQAHLAQVEAQKLKEYLLNRSHPRGGPKAVFFLARGFTASDWESMADALRHHAKNNVISGERNTEYATNYALDCNVPTPDKSNPCIRTVWEIRPEDARPRLITAYPLG
jgi:hypothetical protein